MALKQGNFDSQIPGNQLLQSLHTDETEQKAPDAKIPCDRYSGLGVLKGTSVTSRCGCNFITGTAFPLVPPEFKRWS